MKIMTVGTGGYASVYVNGLLENTDPSIEYVGAVEKYPDTSPAKEKLDEAGIPIYTTMEEFFARHTADLTIISTPTFLHREQSICALSHGSYVLCEKPVAPMIGDAEAMMAAEKQYGKFIAIGYQLAYSKAIRSLKADILSGLFGKPLSLKTIIYGPRNRGYFARGGGWGGRISKDGYMILDSAVSNACAHYVFNMFYVLGKSMDESITPARVKAECFRGHEIENFDTCVMQMETEDHIPLFFATSHATEDWHSVEFEFSFEKAAIRYSMNDLPTVTAEFTDGSRKEYGNPFAGELIKMYDSLEAIASGTAPVCTVKTAVCHTKLIEGLYRNVPIVNFPAALIQEKEDDDRPYVYGLDELLNTAYAQGKLLSELGCAYAEPTEFTIG